MKGETNNKRQAKLLAAVAVMAMVVCALAVAMPAEEADATDGLGPLDFEAEIAGYNSHAEPNGFDGSSIKATNSGLGNNITVVYDAVKKEYTITGTLNKQDISYNNEQWGGTNTSDSAKVFYSAYVKYSTGDGVTEARPYGIVMKSDSNVNITTNNTVGTSFDTEWLKYQSVGKVTYNVFSDNGTKVCTIVVDVTLSTTTSSNAGYVTVPNSNALDGGITSGPGWSLSNTTLTLTNYDGVEYFSGSFTKVVLSGTNVITVDLGYYMSGNIKVGYSAIYSSAQALAIEGTSANSIVDSLKIVQNGADGYGIYGKAVTIGASSGTKDVSITSDGGNRAIYGTVSITIQNADVDISASEKAIRGGGLSITGSTVTAELIDLDPETNSAGADDRYGIKLSGAMTVDTNSTVVTDGLYGSTLTNDGIIKVNGGYTQNTAGDATAVAGLHYANFTSAGVKLTVCNTEPASKPYILLQNGAEYYGNITVKNGSTEVSPAPTIVTDKSEFDTAMANENVDTVVINATSTLTLSGVQVTKDIVVTGTQTVTINGQLVDNSADIIVNGGTLSGTITNMNNSAVLTGVKGNYAISYGSIDIGGEFQSGEIKITNDFKIHGTKTTDGTLNIITDADKMQKITMSGDLTVSKGTLNIGADSAEGRNIALIVPENRTLTVSGGTLNVYGGIAVYGTVVGTVTMDDEGQYAVAEGAVVPAGFGTNGTQVSIYLFEDASGVSNTITGNTEWNTATYLTNDITIAEGVTVTIGDKGYLDLCGHDLVVKGTLVINGKGYITDSGATKGVVYIGDRGEIQNSGIIGYGKSVKVQMYTDAKYTGNGNITLLNVKGVVFGSEKSVSGQNVTYTLTVSGDITYADRTNSSIAFADGVLITGTTEIGRLVGATGAATLDSGSSLTITGTDSGITRTVSITMESNTTFAVTGTYTGTVTAKTGEYDTYTSSGAVNTEAVLTPTSTVTLDNIKGVTYEVGSRTYDVPDPSDASKTISKTLQTLSVSGNSTFVASESGTSATGKVTITGDIHVLAGEALSLSKGMTVDGAGRFVTEGALTVATNGAASSVSKYKGAMYSVEDTESGDITYTYTNFADAFAQIGIADGNAVTLKGGYTFEGEVVVAEGQYIVFADNAAYDIDEDAKVTVQEGGYVEPATGSAPVFNKIYGILVVMDGGECVPAVGSYEVMSENDAGDKTYSSAAVAIKNAVSGTTVHIVGSAVLNTPVTIASGVTVEIADTGSLTANKGLTVAEGGKIVNEGALAIAAEYDLIVAGDIESAEGTVTLGEGSEMTVTGKVTVAAPMNNAAVNGAYYSAEGVTVYTTVAKAVTAVTAMDVKVQIYAVGTFTETGTVTLTQGMVLNVDGTVTLGTVDVEAGANMKVAAAAKLTATVTGASGADGTASVDLVKAGNLAFTVRYDSSRSESTFIVTGITATADVYNITGTATATAGTVTINGTLQFDGKTGSMTIASGAVVSVPENAKIEAEDNGEYVALTVEGTLDIVGGTLDVTAGAFVEVSGTVSVSETTAQTGIQVSGTLTVTGTVSVSAVVGETGNLVINVGGVLVVGEKPETLGAAGTVSGAITTGTNGGYIKAYPGSDLSGAAIDVPTAGAESQAKSTEFYINGSLYMTVISQNTNIFGFDNNVSALLQGENFALTGYLIEYGSEENAVDIADITDWYTDADMTKGATAGAVLGNPEALYFKAISATVDVKVSVGPGISLYIDNIRMVSGESVKLTVGTHTVTAAVDPGYKGDVTVQFNGQAVTGSFTITADMASAAYEGDITVTATGDISVDSTVVENDTGMGLTDYLLIILVVLIVVMAIMVALRLMRS